MIVDLTRTPWPEVPADPLVLIPIGSTEQHGPHLPFDTDAAIAAHVARLAADRIDGPVVVVPPLAFGASGEHQAFPGTTSIGTEALVVVLVELARSVHSWAPRLVFVNGHGGNLDALGRAIGQLRQEGHDAAWAPCVVAGGDAHAGQLETAALLALRPADVGPMRPVGVTTPLPQLLPALRTSGMRAVAPDGVLGDARGALASDGERLLAAMAASVARRVRGDVVEASGMLRDPGSV